MKELNRLKPICLLIIPGLNLDDVLNSSLFPYVGKYPFTVLKSADVNVDCPWNSFLEIGTGTSIKDNLKRISLSSLLSEAGLQQLRLAETEDFANISYFFNNLEKRKNNNEKWINIPPTKLDDYLGDPEMMTGKISSLLIKEIEKKNQDFILTVFSSLIDKKEDESRKKSLDFIVSKIKSIVNVVSSNNGLLILTSNTTNQKNNNFVPLFLFTKKYRNQSFRIYDYQKDIKDQKIGGDIYDISPTILKLLGISKPEEMKGNSLV